MSEKSRADQVQKTARRFASVQESADLVLGAKKTLPQTTIPTIGIVKEPRRKRTTHDKDLPLGVVGNTDDILTKKIEVAADLANQTRELSNHYMQKNIAESSVATDIAATNAPVTDAIKELQDQVSEIAKAQSTDKVARRTTKDTLRAAQQTALLDSINAVKDEITTSIGVSSDVRDDLIIKLSSLEAKLNTGNILSAENLDKIQSTLEAIEAKASLPTSSSTPTEPTVKKYEEEAMASLADNFDDIDAIADADGNESFKAIVGDQLYGALRTAVSNYHSGDLTAADYGALKQAIPALKKLTEHSPSLAAKLADIIGNEEKKKEEEGLIDDITEATDIWDSRDLLTGSAKATDTVIHKRGENKKYFNGREITYDEYDTHLHSPAITVEGHSYKLTKGLALLLTSQKMTRNNIDEDIRSKYVTRQDIKDYLQIFRDTHDPNDTTNKFELLLDAETKLASAEASSSGTYTTKGKGIITNNDIAQRPGGPYHIDKAAYESGMIKIFGPPKVFKGREVRPKALLTIPVSDDLQLLLSNKSISPVRKLDPAAVEHFKTIHSYLGLQVGKQGTRYALIHGTKMPKNKAKVIKLSPSVLKKTLTENIGLIRAGNTSEELKLRTLTIMNQLKDVSMLDQQAINEILPLLQ